MPKIALADTLREWESLLAAADEHAATTPELEKQLVRLRAALTQTRELDHLRQRLQADLQTATQSLTATRQEGRDLVSGVRSLLISRFGPHWEGLTQFGIRLRRPTRRSRSRRVPSPDAGALPASGTPEA